MRKHRSAWSTVLLVALAAPSIAFGQGNNSQSDTTGGYGWTPARRADFMTECPRSCRENSKLPDQYKYQCDAYCGCVMNEGQRFTTSADMDEFDRIVAIGQTNPLWERFKTLFKLCSERTFR